MSSIPLSGSLHFNGSLTPEVEILDRLLGSEPLLIGDLILVEVLQGFRSEADFSRAHQVLGALEFAGWLGGEWPRRVL